MQYLSKCSHNEMPVFPFVNILSICIIYLNAKPNNPAYKLNFPLLFTFNIYVHIMHTYVCILTVENNNNKNI